MGKVGLANGDADARHFDADEMLRSSMSMDTSTSFSALHKSSSGPSPSIQVLLHQSADQFAVDTPSDIAKQQVLHRNP